MKVFVGILKLVAIAGILAVLIQVAYNAGRIDGWHIAINDYQAVTDYQVAYDRAGANRTEQDISRAWDGARAAAEKRAADWFSPNFVIRIDRGRNIHPTEIWKMPAFPGELLTKPHRGVDLFPVIPK